MPEIMIELTRGDLLEAHVEALVNTVNTVGIMGKGIALQFKQAFPEPRASAAAPPLAAVGCRSLRWTPRGSVTVGNTGTGNGGWGMHSYGA
jgi:O-acetyl-ADP-ribose deacetylase (regulator of RNase III)